MSLPVWYPSVISVAQRLGLKFSSRNPKIRCVFHDEKVPSLVLYEDHFHCYGCGAHGGPVELAAQVLRCGHHEASRWVRDGVFLIFRSRDRYNELARSQKISQWVARSLRAGAYVYEALLWLAKELDNRGLRDHALGAYADAFALGDENVGILAAIEARSAAELEADYCDGKHRWHPMLKRCLRGLAYAGLAVRLKLQEDARHIANELREMERVFEGIIADKGRKEFAAAEKALRRLTWREQKAQKA